MGETITNKLDQISHGLASSPDLNVELIEIDPVTDQRYVSFCRNGLQFVNLGMYFTFSVKTR
jgi:hypothetical protein